MGGGGQGVGGALETLAQFFVLLQQVFRVGYIAIGSGSSSLHRFRGSSRVRNTRVLLDSGHGGKTTGLHGERGNRTRPFQEQCWYQNRMTGPICCQRKMHGNYPSVAKACTFARFRPERNVFENRRESESRR